MKLLRVIFVILLSLIASSAIAVNSWYVGKVKRVAFIGGDGSFLVQFNNANLDDCENKQALFYSGVVGAERLKGAYSMAITSLTTGVNMGVVIDKQSNGPGGECRAVGMAADLRS